MSFEPGYVLAKSIILPWIKFGYRTHIEGSEHLPKQGGFIVAVNHISLFDPFAVAYALDRAGRHPRFFAKSSLFGIPIAGWILRTARQIRVDRGTSSAPTSLVHAEEALAAGEAVVIFPEGTTSLSPDLAPLPPKTGVARLALATKTPIIPCATWGGQWIWGYHVGFRPKPGKDVWVRFGAPLSLEEFEGRADEPAAWDELSEAVMSEIAVLLVGLKAAKPWTPRPLRKRIARKKGI